MLITVTEYKYINYVNYRYINTSCFLVTVFLRSYSKILYIQKEAYSYRTSQVEISSLTISITEDLWFLDLSADSELIKLELK